MDGRRTAVVCTRHRLPRDYEFARHTPAVIEPGLSPIDEGSFTLILSGSGSLIAVPFLNLQGSFAFGANPSVFLLPGGIFYKRMVVDPGAVVIGAQVTLHRIGTSPVPRSHSRSVWRAENDCLIPASASRPLG